MKDGAELFRLRLKSRKLRLQIFALKRERLLRILGADQLLSQLERRVHVLLGIGQDMSAHRLGAALCRAGRVAVDAGCALRHREKAFERLAQGKTAQNLVRGGA